jgi:Zn-dependent peptidase ImmA (M78 family)
MIDNYLEDTENAAAEFIRKFDVGYKGIDRIDLFRSILINEYGYTIEEDSFGDVKDLETLRYLYRPDCKILMLNEKINKNQYLFILGREIGYNFLGITDRSFTSSWVEVKKFDHILNNFKAYYFSSAIILHEKNFVKGLIEFSTNVEFDPERLVDLMESYNSNAEMFMLRITNLIPRFFKFHEMFFFRYNHDLTTNTFSLTKDLLLSGLHKQHGMISDFQPCKRWSGITILKELSILQEKNEYKRPICRINRVKYSQTTREYLIISVAHPMYPTQNMNCSINVGFQINEKLLRRIKFLNDPKIPFTEIDLDWIIRNSGNCEDDLEKPSVMIKESKTRKIREAVNELLSGQLVS